MIRVLFLSALIVCQALFLLGCATESADNIGVDETPAENVNHINETVALVERGEKSPVDSSLQGTGRMIKPLSGYEITSEFNAGKGKKHNGIDMAVESNARIGAADGGTVIFAGHKESYGNTIIIDHGGGVQTLYARCSILHVKLDDKVYQGQLIAEIGDDSHSGDVKPHLHFEVHIDGIKKNPLDYL